MNKKLEMSPIDLLNIQEDHYLLMTSLFSMAQNDGETLFILRKALEEKRKGETKPEYEARLLDALSPIGDRLYTLKEAPAQNEATRKSIAILEGSLTSLLSSPLPKVQKEASKLLALNKMRWDKTEIVDTLSLSAWKKLLAELPKLAADEKRLSAAETIVREHAASLKSDPVNHREMEKALATLLSDSNQAEAQRVALELLRTLPLQDPDTFLKLHSEKLNKEHTRSAKALADRMLDGPDLDPDPKSVKALELSILTGLNSLKTQRPAILLAGLIGTTNQEIQALLFDIHYGSGNRQEFRDAAEQSIEKLSSRNLLSYDLVKDLLERERTGNLGFTVADDKALVKAYTEGPVKPLVVTAQLLASIKTANTSALDLLADEAVKRGTTDPLFLRAILERIFSKGLLENQRVWAVTNIAPKLKFPDVLVKEIVAPLIQSDSVMSRAATLFIGGQMLGAKEKATRPLNFTDIVRALDAGAKPDCGVISNLAPSAGPPKAP